MTLQCQRMAPFHCRKSAQIEEIFLGTWPTQQPTAKMDSSVEKSSRCHMIASDHRVHSNFTSHSYFLVFGSELKVRYRNLGVVTFCCVHVPLCGCDFPMELGTKVKNTKISSRASGGIFAKVCTRESFPLYGTCKILRPGCEAKEPYTSEFRKTTQQYVGSDKIFVVIVEFSSKIIQNHQETQLDLIHESQMLNWIKSGNLPAGNKLSL